MEDMGQVGPISVLPETEMTGTFTVREVKQLDKPGQNCEPNEQYSFTQCLRTYVTRTTKCKIDILANSSNCTYDGLVKFSKILRDIKIMNKKNITDTTGCLPKCSKYQYSFKKRTEDDAGAWRKDWLSSFYLSSPTTIRTISVETYSYDDQVLYTKLLHIFLTS